MTVFVGDSVFLKRIELMHEDIPSFNNYPFSIPAIKNLRQLDLQSKVTFFVGENGSGKSTLLEAIAYKCQFNTAGGGRNNYYDVHASESALGEYIRLSWLPKVTNGFFLRAESFYNFATHIDKIGPMMHMADALYTSNHMESLFYLFF